MANYGTNRVEGYLTSNANGVAGKGGDSWVYGLRKEARRELIRRLTLERIQAGGLADGPKSDSLPPGLSQQDGLLGFIGSLGIPKRVFEGVLIAVASAWLCHHLGVRGGKR